VRYFGLIELVDLEPFAIIKSQPGIFQSQRAAHTLTADAVKQ